MLAFHEAHFSLEGLGDFTARFLFPSFPSLNGVGIGRGKPDGHDDDDSGGSSFGDLGGFGLDGHDRIHELLRRGCDDGYGFGREALAFGGELEREQEQDREQEQEWYGPGEGDGDGYDEWYDDEEEDDGLGYYPDGVKRTLTDDQIAIFRHSEMEALKREAGKKAEAEANRKSFAGVAGETAAQQEGRGSTKRKAELSDGEEEEEEGEISSATPPLLVPTEKKSKKRRKKRKNGLKDGEEPVDLRKRTWDVVDTGLATLDYGEEEGEDGGARGGGGRAVQRRTVSYDD